MSYKNRLLEKLNMPSTSKDDGQESDASIAEMMMNPSYLRQSSSLVNQALQKGFDVLQMEDGEIVMTGTKTIVYRYQWDSEKGMLVKKVMEDKDEDERLTLPEIETL